MAFRTRNASVISIGIVLAVFTVAARYDEPDLRLLMKQCEEKLGKAYAADMENKEFKKVEIQLTKDGFFRYRRTFISGKQEYFSFSFSQFNELDYLGTAQSGLLVLKTLPESIIVQTFHDPKGNVDTMANELKLPLKQLEAADLQAFEHCFLQIREKLQP